MAFSTQKDFLKIAFLNDRLEPVCTRKPGVKLKSYVSCTDHRAWAMNKEKQAHFLADLVACRNYATNSYTEGEYENRGTSQNQQRGKGADFEGPMTDYDRERAEKDSLLEYAQEKLEDIEKVMNENKKLRENLEMSNDKASILEDENKKIKEIIAKHGDPANLSPFHKKIQELRAQGKITAEDERSLLEMQQYVGCKDKQYKVLEAENNSLKMLVEKLAERTKVNQIPSEKETSTDVNYLQGLVDDLREEVGILRGLEQDNEKVKLDFEALKTKYDSMSGAEKEEKLNQDAEMLAAIIEERDNLRDQLAKMVGIEDKIALLRQRAMDADRLEKELNDLKDKLNDLEQGSRGAVSAIDSLAEKSRQDAHAIEYTLAERDCLKNKCEQLEAQLDEMEEMREQQEELCQELRNAHSKLKKMQCLEQELINTKKRLKRSETALEDYECQMHQLMDVIEELEAQKCFCCCDQGGGSGDQIKDGHIGDLIQASKMALTQIQSEFISRESLQRELEKSMHEIDSLKEEANKQNSRIRRTSDLKINELLDQLEKCKADNNKLKEEVTSLGGKLRNSEAELETVNQQIGHLREEIKSDDTTPKTTTEEETCCAQLSKLRDAIEQDKQKWASERSNLEKQLNDLNEKYTKAKEDCEKSKESAQKANEEIGKLITEVEESKAEITSLTDALEDPKQLLAAAKTELEQYRNELSQCNDKAQQLADANKSLQDKVDNLQNDNAQLSKRLKDKENEVSALNSKISDIESQLAACQEKIKGSSDSEGKYQNDISNLKKSLDDCTAELNRLRSEKDNISDTLAKKDDEIKSAINQLDKCKADLEALRKELQDKINGLQAEKAALERQIEVNKSDLDQLGKLVADIEAERAKNKKLEEIAQDFEKQLKEMPKEVTSPVAGADAQVQQAMDELKRQLERETARVNELESQLANCRQQLSASQAAAQASEAKAAAAQAAAAQAAAAQAAAAQAQGPVQGVAQPPTPQLSQQSAQEPGQSVAQEPTQPPAQQPDQVAAAVEGTVRAIEREKTASLTKIQGIHDNQLQDLIRNHDKEIEALKLANKALRDSLMNLKQGFGVSGESMDLNELQKQIEELKKGVCTCGKKKVCPMSKLQEVCMKIVEQGIECLNLKELTYLHSEVYKAGLKLKPELVGGDKEQRCCKCTGFSCCLPNIPKDAEKRLITRIMCLENEVENANKILQHLKTCSEKKPAVARTSFSAERSNVCRVNDEINEFLKRSKNERKRDAIEVTEIYRKCKKSATKRKCQSSARDSK